MCCHPTGGRNDITQISGATDRKSRPRQDDNSGGYPHPAVQPPEPDAWTQTMDPCPKRTSRFRVS
jgi:hypothetical protein